MKLHCLLPGLLLWFADSLHAQLRFDNYSVEKGLSASTVLDLIQSSDGFMWIATAEGLNRYDGHSFTVFRSRPQATTGLQDNYLTALAEDRLRRIWIGANDGSITLYDGPGARFIRHPALQQFNPARVPILSIKADSAGYVCWLLQQGGAWLAETKTQQLTPRALLWNDSSFLPYCMGFAPDGKLWLGGQGGIRVLDPGNPDRVEAAWLTQSTVLALAFHGAQVFAATSGEGLHWIGNGMVRRISTPGSEAVFRNIIAMKVDAAGNLWCANNYFNGVQRFSIRGRGLSAPVSCMYNPFNRESLANNSVLCLEEDREGNVWIGTLSGLSVFKPLNQQYGLLRHIPGDPNSLSTGNTYGLFEDVDGSIWSGSLDGGINKIMTDGRILHFGEGNTRGLPSNSVRSIHRDKSGRYWVGAGNEGLFRFFPESRSFQKLTARTAEGYMLQDLQVKTITEDPLGNLWLGTTAGLWRYHPARNMLHHFDVIPESLRNQPNLPDYQIMEVRFDPHNNQLLCATFGHGLLVVNLDGKVLERIHQQPEVKKGLSSNNVMCVVPLGADTLLLGTYGGGLNILNRRSGQIHALTTANGLSNDVIYGILNDGRGNLWMSSNRGLMIFNPGSGQVHPLNQGSRVQSLEFNEGTYLKTRDGRLWFGGINGINYFKPESLRINTTAPKTAITALKVMEKSFPFDSFYHLEKPILLRHNQNFLRIDFTGLSFVNSPQNRFMYKLEGLDETWIEAGDNRSAAYTNLPPGNYTFMVKSCNDDGIWSSGSAMLFIQIQPPYWRTWWFLLLVLLLFIALLLLVFRIRTGALRRNYQLTLAETELKALRGQMNPHFIFNSINSIQYYVLNKSPGEAYSYLAKFSSLMRQILQNSRFSFIPLDQELQSLETYLELEKLRLDGNLDYSISLDQSLRGAQVMIPSMIIQPYVENAILHGLTPLKDVRPHLSINMERAENHIYCVVQDNGIGREQSKALNSQRRSRHESTGMSVTRQRLEMLNRRFKDKVSVAITDLKNEQGSANGTRVAIFIPINLHHEHEGTHR
jgi:ligand-binding sensor domain-containing protein